MQISKNKVVEIDYTLTDPNGAVLDSSKGRPPLAYMHGTGALIPGLETELEGKSTGEQMIAVLPPEKAYGVKNKEMVQTVLRSAFKGIDDIKAGMQFQANGPEGTRVVTVVAVTDKDVTVDANHPLAGMELKFDVKIVSVREATEEEIDHGHAHGAGGHHH